MVSARAGPAQGHETLIFIRSRQHQPPPPTQDTLVLVTYNRVNWFYLEQFLFSNIMNKINNEKKAGTKVLNSGVVKYWLKLNWEFFSQRVYCALSIHPQVRRHQKNIYWKKIVSKFLQFYPTIKYFENANILKYWKILPLEFIPKLCNIGWKIFVKFMTLRKFKVKVLVI